MFDVFNPAFAARVRAKRRKIAQIERIERVRNRKTSLREMLLADGKPTALRILQVVAEEHGVTVDAIIAPTRGGPLVCEVRKAAMRAVIQQRPDLTVTQVARVFRRDHSTILQTIGATR
jgi:chromosomal replication initiation ATPase DnaA